MATKKVIIIGVSVLAFMFVGYVVGVLTMTRVISKQIAKDQANTIVTESNLEIRDQIKYPDTDLEPEPTPHIPSFIDHSISIPEYGIVALVPNNWIVTSSTPTPREYGLWQGISGKVGYYRVGPEDLVNSQGSNFPFLGCAISKIDSNVDETLTRWFASYTKKIPWWDGELSPGRSIETFDGANADGMRVRLYESNGVSEMVIYKIGSDIISVHYFISQEGLNQRQYPRLDRACEEIARYMELSHQ